MHSTANVAVVDSSVLDSATVFLLILCNDKKVLGPWVNGRKVNILTAVVVFKVVLLVMP